MVGYLREISIGQSQLHRGQALLLSFILLFTIFTPTSSSTKAAQNTLSKVFHVYVDEEYVGKINDKEIIDIVINEKLAQEENQEMELFIDEEVTYIKERSFNPRYNNDLVKRTLENILTVKTLAYELKIDDAFIGHFESEQMVSDILEQYKHSFINKKDLKKLKKKKSSLVSSKETLYIENKQLSEKDRQPLSVGESELIDAYLDNEIDLAKVTVEPMRLLTIKEGLSQLNQGTVEEEKHTIAKGEVLQSIAKKYDMPVKELLNLNPGITEDSILQIDQELNVTAYKPAFDVIAIEESVVEKKVAYETEIIESDKMYKGEEKVKQKGKSGKKKVHYQIEKTNGLETEREIIKEEVIKKPEKKIIIRGTKVIPSRGSGNYIWPANGGYISSNYGHRWGRLHKGIDIARPSNRTIKAADHGVVSFAGYHGGYGNKIVINHNNGMKTLYAHLSSINVRVGQTIEKGTAIGVMGSTGNSTGVHLHFEIHRNGVPQNPLQYY